MKNAWQMEVLGSIPTCNSENLFSCFIHSITYVDCLGVILFLILVSLVDYYKVDKEDIVTTNTAPDSAPPALPPVAQTLPSQPLDVLFIERRGDLAHFLFIFLFVYSGS